MQKTISFTKKFLKQEYIINKKGSYQIGKENNCSSTTIRNKLKEYNIPIRNIQEAANFKKCMFNFTKKFLKQEYLTNKKTITQISNENNCSITTIRKGLKEYNIPIRNIAEAANFKKSNNLIRNYNFTKEFLEQEYIINKKTMRQIAKENNCSDGTIYNNLQKYNIPTKGYIFFTKEFLEQEYLVNKKSMAQIAKENNCSDSTILNKLRKYNIPTRNKSEAYIKFIFSKKFLEQEYLVNKKTMEEIALEQNCNVRSIKRNLIKHNIPLRNKSEITKLQWKKRCR